MNKANMDSPARRFWQALGFLFEAGAFALGGYGLALFFTHRAQLFQNPGLVISTFRFARHVGGLPVLARLAIFLVMAAAFTIFMSLAGREFRRINRVLGGVIAALAAYAYAGIVFLCSLTAGIDWVSDLHIVGNFFFGAGVIIALFFVVGAGLKTRRLRWALGVLFGLVSLPAQYVLLVLIFPLKDLSTALFWILPPVLFVVNLVVFSTSAGDNREG